MSDFNLDALAPEEKDDLLRQLLAKHGEASDGAGNNDDLLKVIEILCNVVEGMDDRLTMLEKMVQDDIIGGVETLYKGNLRAKGIEGLRGKHGALFDPHMDALKELSPDEDIFDKLYDMIEEAKAGEGWDDAKEADMVGNMASGIAAKIAKIRGDTPSSEVVTSEEPALVVEKTEVSAAPGGDGMDPELKKRVEAMKAANTARGK